MELQKYPLFKCLVGSRAHGLNDPDSDYDYRGVFALPTESLLALGQTVKTTSWVEGEVDDTSWEECDSCISLENFLRHWRAIFTPRKPISYLVH